MRKGETLRMPSNILGYFGSKKLNQQANNTEYPKVTNSYSRLPAVVDKMIHGDWKDGDTVSSLVSGHPRELEKVSVSRAVHFRELFP